MGGMILMSEISKNEDAWQCKATESAIAEARKITEGSGLQLWNTPVGRLSDQQWGWLLTAAIFGWIRTRCEQAIAEGIDRKELVRVIGLSPSPGEVAVVRSILPALADQAAVDWSRPLAMWSKDEMVNFLLLVRQLIDRAEIAFDQAPHKILRKSTKSDFDDKAGDAIPF
jgi:hypothetical protein